MKFPRRAVALCMAPSILLTGCINLNEQRIQQLAITDATAEGTSQCAPKGEFATLASADDAHALLFAPRDQRSVSEIEYQAESTRAHVPDFLSENPVIQETISLGKLAAVEAAAANHEAALHQIQTELRAPKPSAAFAMNDVRTLAPAELSRVETGLSRVVASDDAEVKKLRSDVGRQLKRSDFVDLESLLREKLLRTTTPTKPTAAPMDSENTQFWEDFKAYYNAYYQGKFVDYFGNAYAKPAIALTVTDVELGNTMNVFIEFLFDETAKTPVWIKPATPTETVTASGKVISVAVDKGAVPTKGDQVKITFMLKSKAYPITYAITAASPDAKGLAKAISDAITSDKDAKAAGISATSTSDSSLITVAGVDSISIPKDVTLSADQSATYFPGGTTNRPTVLSVQGRDPVPLASDNECGMTELKATVMNTLAQSFASGASSAAATAVGTIGGIEIGPGVIFGKINIGDNKAVTALVQTMVTEIVARLTIEAAYPVLTQIQQNSTDTEMLTRAFYYQ